MLANDAHPPVSAVTASYLAEEAEDELLLAAPKPPSASGPFPLAYRPSGKVISQEFPGDRLDLRF